MEEPHSARTGDNPSDPAEPHTSACSSAACPSIRLTRITTTPKVQVKAGTGTDPGETCARSTIRKLSAAIAALAEQPDPDCYTTNRLGTRTEAHAFAGKGPGLPLRASAER